MSHWRCIPQNVYCSDHKTTVIEKTLISICLPITFICGYKRTCLNGTLWPHSQRVHRMWVIKIDNWISLSCAAFHLCAKTCNTLRAYIYFYPPEGGRMCGRDKCEFFLFYRLNMKNIVVFCITYFKIFVVEKIQKLKIEMANDAPYNIKMELEMYLIEFGELARIEFGCVLKTRKR